MSCTGLLRVCLLGLAALFVAPAATAQESPAAAQPVAESLLPTTEHWIGDLDGMRKRRTIRLLVPYSKTFYFVDKGGKQFGITYDVGHAFEEWLNKREKTKTLKIGVVFIPVARERLLSGLVDGTGDIAAGNITITEQRAAIAQFGDPFAKDIKEVLVIGPTAAPIATLDDLAGREIFARRSSSYFEHLQSLSSALEAKGLKAIAISELDDELEDEDILEMVNAGLLPWAVVDEHKAQVWTSVFTKLTARSDLAINQGGEIAWAMRKDNPQLLEVVNEFTKTHKIGTTFGNILKKRYLGGDSFVKRSTSTEELEKFQAIAELFRKYGQQYDFDWLMIAAQGYQESKLDQSARSPRGAVGVMQLMPKTAADPVVGIPNIESVDNNIHAGVKYLRTLVDKYLDDPALDRKNRTLMAFAAYNAGPGNLRKFRKLAADSGLDPNIWFHNVEHAAAEIVGRETVQYVANIYKYYVAYRLATERNEERSKAKQGVAPAAQ
ncbi:MAG: transglycosylase SLT domain-containing protein [Rhodospirillaceae bacterium]|nr:transglycosylase SLT domain-containing protein [Rhodospirillaceae bacterium]